MPDPSAADFDSILDKLTVAAGGTAGGVPGAMDPMVQMMMMQMQMDRADRASSRQTMMQMLGTLLPAILPLLFKKDADPMVMTLLQGVLAKNNDGEQTKAMLQMMAAGNQMSMDQMRTSLMSIMQMKDDQTKKMLEEASEKGDSEPAEGFAGVVREIRMGLGSLVPLITSAPQQPQALPAPGANPAPPQQRMQPKPPVVVVLNQMKGIQTGAIKKPEQAAALAAMVTVALQDAKLVEAFDTGDINEVVAYCVPYVSTEPKLMSWLQTAGVGEWVNQYVENRLGPMLDVAREDDVPADDGTPADGVNDNEPEELAPPAAGEG